MEVGIMTAVAIFLATVVAIYLTKGISVMSFIVQVIPMSFAALYIIMELMTKINQGVIVEQVGYMTIGTIIVIVVFVLNRSVQLDSIKHSSKEIQF